MLILANVSEPVPDDIIARPRTYYRDKVIPAGSDGAQNATGKMKFITRFFRLRFVVRGSPAQGLASWGDGRAQGLLPGVNFGVWCESGTFARFITEMPAEGTYVNTDVELTAAANAVGVNLQIFGSEANYDRRVVPRLDSNITVNLVHYTDYHYRLAMPTISGSRPMALTRQAYDFVCCGRQRTVVY